MEPSDDQVRDYHEKVLAEFYPDTPRPLGEMHPRELEYWRTALRIAWSISPAPAAGGGGRDGGGFGARS